MYAGALHVICDGCVWDVGSRFIYSTCSLNPLEDEAVVCAILKRHGATLRLVPIRQRLADPAAPTQGCLREQWEGLRGLKWRDGLNTWRVDVGVMTDEGVGSGSDTDTVGGSEEDPEESGEQGAANPLKRRRDQTQAREVRRSVSKLPPLVDSMYPPSSPEQREQMHLDYSMRIFPHDQDTGGFYIAVFERYAPEPGEQWSAAPLLSHQAEVSILKNVCGFNPKQQHPHPPRAGKAGEQDAFLQECNAYTYEPMAVSDWDQLRTAVSKDASPQDTTVSARLLSHLVRIHPRCTSWTVVYCAVCSSGPRTRTHLPTLQILIWKRRVGLRLRQLPWAGGA